MKVLIISDSHGNIANLKHVIGFAKKSGFGAVIHAGDWNRVESVETVLSFGIPLYSVIGNADIDPEIGKRLKENASLRGKSKSFSADFVEFEIDRKKIGVTHKPADINEMLSKKKFDIVFHGHTHKITDSTVFGVRVINPGAIVKGNNFAVYDTTSGKIEFVHE